MSFRGNRLGAVVAFRAGDAEGVSRAKTRCRHGIGKLPVSYAISCVGQPHGSAFPKRNAPIFCRAKSGERQRKPIRVRDMF